MKIDKTVKVFLSPGVTDLRKSYNGLYNKLKDQMGINIHDKVLVGFSNRTRTMVKFIYYDQNGLAIWMKKLDDTTFDWPEDTATNVILTRKQYNFLLDNIYRN